MNKIVILLNVIPFGLYCMFFTSHAIGLITSFINLFNINGKQSRFIIKHIHVRVLGGLNLVLAALVAFDLVMIR